MDALIVGCGGSFGKELIEGLEKNGYTIHGISGTQSANEKFLKIDWDTCGIQDFEKFLRNLPQINLIVFNQNSPALIDKYIKLNSMNILDVWKRAKRWNQSHYVNCILPTHILHTLSLTNKLMDSSRVVWILSRSMFGHMQSTPIDYVGQKYQNYTTMQALSQHNPQTFIGLCPGNLDPSNTNYKVKTLVEFLNTVDNTYSGKLFLQNDKGITEFRSD
jgi:hypothetical protein